MLSQAQTNHFLEYWVRSFDVGLVAYTNAPIITNGIIAFQKKATVRITSKDLIHLLSGLPAFTIGKALTNYPVVVTNFVEGPNIVTTNIAEIAYPVYERVIPPPYSTKARLLILEAAGTNSLSTTQIVVRDGVPATDYVVSEYFDSTDVSFDHREDPMVTYGKRDVFHGLVDIKEVSIQRFFFDDNAFSGVPPGTYFDVQGFNSREIYSHTRNADILAPFATRSVDATVAGTGQVGGQENFAVFTGSIKSSGGKYETK